MHVAIWRYEVGEATRAGFLAAYGGDGVWARFFRQAEGYTGTRLLEDSERRGSFVTLDFWTDEAARLEFLAANADAYRRLDEQTAGLTLVDVHVGFLASAQDWSA